VGIVEALEEGELPAAMAGLGMTIAAVCTALLAPAAAWLVSA
jgi:putative effector of murein hydrolase